MRTETYGRSLPLLAAALSGRRGIRVEIGGDRACTDGTTIRLPSLPLAMDDALLGVARGYIDHESAHVLFSAFDALKDAGLSPLETYFANVIEDVRVEALMAERFPGCRRNFRETARHVFLDRAKDAHDTSFAVPSYVLLRLRRATCPELAGRAAQATLDVARLFPGLLQKLEPVFAAIAASCPDTEAAVAYGKRLAALLREYGEEHQAENGKGPAQDAGSKGESQNGSAMAEDGDDAGPSDEDTAASPGKLSGAGAGDMMSGDLGEALARELEEHRTGGDDAVLSASDVPAQGCFRPMPEGMLARTVRLQALLRPMLRGVLQADTYEGRMPSVHGKLHGRRLYEVPLGSRHVFTRRMPARLTATALHILIDRSGSTTGFIDDVAVSAYAVAHAASGIRGVTVGITVFPADTYEDDSGRPGVATLIRHGQTAHSRLAFGAGGCTPLAEAVWHALPSLMRAKGPRRVLLLFTDGMPDSMPKAEAALRDAKALGIEVYGVSYRCGGITRLLGDRRSIVIQDADELPSALSTMLLAALRGAA